MKNKLYINKVESIKETITKNIDSHVLRVTSEYQSLHYMILRDHIHSSVSSEI